MTLFHSSILSRGIVCLIGLLFVFSAIAEDLSDATVATVATVSDSPEAEGQISVELVKLKQRSIDFKKDQVLLSERDHFSSEEKSDLKSILKQRETEAADFEKQRLNYVRTQDKVVILDAVKREAIEDKFQEEKNLAQVKREKRFAQARARRERIISHANLNIDENKEYDLRIPLKRSRSKLKGMRKSK